MLTTLGTTTDSVQGDDNRRKKQRKVRLQESSAFTPSSMVFPCRPPRVPAASSVLFFTVKHPGRPSPGIPVCNFPLCLKSDVWIIYLSMMSLMSRFCITGLFFFLANLNSFWLAFLVVTGTYSRSHSSGPTKVRDTIASIHTVRVGFDCSPSIDYRDFTQVWRDSTHTARWTAAAMTFCLFLSSFILSWLPEYSCPPFPPLPPPDWYSTS